MANNTSKSTSQKQLGNVHVPDLLIVFYQGQEINEKLKKNFIGFTHHSQAMFLCPEALEEEEEQEALHGNTSD